MLAHAKLAALGWQLGGPTVPTKAQMAFPENYVTYTLTLRLLLISLFSHVKLFAVYTFFKSELKTNKKARDFKFFIYQ